MRGRIAACSERLPRCEVAAVSPQSSESALAGRRGCVPRRQETGGRRRQNRQFCGYFISALTTRAGIAATAATAALSYTALERNGGGLGAGCRDPLIFVG